MNKLRIILEDTVNRAGSILTDVPDTSSTSSPVNNLQYYSRSNIFETTASGSTDLHTVYLELPIAEFVSAVVLGRHNFPIGMQLQIYLYSDSAFTNIAHNSGLLTIDANEAGSDVIEWQSFLWGNVLWGEDSVSEEFSLKPNYVYWLDSITVQSIKIELLVPTQDVEIGRLIVGNYIQPEFTTSYGHQISFVENTKQFRIGGNTLRSTNVAPARKLSFPLNTITEADRIVLQKGLRHVGLRKDLFISIFPDDTDLDKKNQYSGIMKLTKIPSMSEYAPMYYNSKYEMEEV